MKVADLFCGAGGISEGFRTAGFDIVFGLDKKKDACRTFLKNHHLARVVTSDILSFSFEELPDFDILVGGPPCVNFSNSKGSRRNVLEGLELVQAFLRIVYWSKPKYWIMENVPAITKYLPSEIPLEWIGIKDSGSLEIPVRAVFNSAEYGVPQRRKRYLTGNFISPDPTHGKFINLLPFKTLGEVVESLSDCSNLSVYDINYDFYLPIEKLTDHFCDVSFDIEELERIKRAKTEHPYMGRMAFPDPLDKPARTVVATQLGRETLVINKGNGIFRRATVRECATLQSFPITYQFWANNTSAKYRLAGDAVPPLLAYSLAKKIATKEFSDCSSVFLTRKNVYDLAPSANLTKRKSKNSTFNFNRKFSQMIPGKEIRGCRVELDNKESDFATPKIIWSCRLHVGEGKHNRWEKIFHLEEALRLLHYFDKMYDNSNSSLTSGFLNTLEKSLADYSCSSQDVQISWIGKGSQKFSPFNLCSIATQVVDTYFSKCSYSKHKIILPASSTIPRKTILVRILAGLVASSYVAFLISGESSRSVYPGYLLDIYYQNQDSGLVLI